VSKRRALVGIMAVSALLAALSGCTAAANPTPLPVLNSERDWGPFTEIGVGSDAITVPIPPGPTSVEVSVSCTRGEFQITINQDTRTSRVGECGRVSRYRSPLTATLTATANLQVAVTVPRTSSYSFEVQFLRTIASPDPTLQTECARLSDADRILRNAEDGFRAGMLSSADWASAIMEAFTNVNIRSSAAPIFDLPLPALAAGFASAVGTPGSPPSSVAFEIAAVTAVQMCASNQTPIAGNQDPIDGYPAQNR
jgi:hypothetical protein